MPTGTAITLFFFGLELGPNFASQSAVFNLAGIVAMSSFLYFYYVAPRITGRDSVIGSSIVAIIGYFAAALLIKSFSFEPFTATAAAILSIPLFSFLFRKIAEPKIMQKVKLNANALFVRAALATAIILIVTGTAKLAGPVFAGLFSAFPATAFPLIIIIHCTYGSEYANVIIKNFPAGLTSLIAYSLVVHFTYPSFGVFLGTGAALAAALLAAFCSVMLAQKSFKQPTSCAHN